MNDFRVYTKKRLNQRSIFSSLHNLSATTLIIAINIIFFLFVLILGLFFGAENVVNLVAIQPLSILAGKNLWTVLTSMFMHAGFLHLFVNMVSLFFIGSFVERLIGKVRFLIFYLISGIFAGLFFVLLAFLFKSDMSVYAVGASGAIFALGGLLAVLTPKLKVYVFFFIPMQMWLGMIFLLGVLWFVSITGSISIGNTAHLGGLIAGVIYGLYLRGKYKRKIQILNNALARSF